MIVYLDASALVKRYVAEAGSAEVEALINEAQAIGTAVISRAEVAAALARATRIGLVTRSAGVKALQAFNADWEHLVRLQLGEPLAARAAALAWEHGLRGYDSVHLASALAWSVLDHAAIFEVGDERRDGRIHRRKVVVLERVEHVRVQVPATHAHFDERDTGFD